MKIVIEHIKYLISLMEDCKKNGENCPNEHSPYSVSKDIESCHKAIKIIESIEQQEKLKQRKVRPSEYMLMTDGYTRRDYERELNEYINYLEHQLSERQTSTDHSDSTDNKALHIADVVRSFPIKAKHKSFGDIEIVGIITDDATYHQVRYYAKIGGGFAWVYDYDVLWTY